MLSGLYNIRIEGLLFIQPLYFDCNGMVVMNRTTDSNLNMKILLNDFRVVII